MNTEERLRIAYTLLPPPLAALPAKYWTSISLWLHSYSVATTFQLFINEYHEKISEDTIDEEEAFIIGFLHDMAQKMGIIDKLSLEGVRQWVEEGLEAYGLTPDEAKYYLTYLVTNPAETMLDPALPRSARRLLWISDRLQGASNPLDIVSILAEARKDLGIDLDILLLNITIPQPHLRSLLSRIVYEEILDYAKESPNFVVPVSTPMGLAIITSDPTSTRNNVASISWDVVREGLVGKGLIDDTTEDNLRWDSDCCDNPRCREECSGRSKPSHCSEHKYTRGNCEMGVHPDFRGNSYKIALIYYGYRSRIQGRVILPSHVRDMLQGFELSGVEFAEGTYICPICGLRTPVGVPGDFLQFFNSKIKTEQWNRTLYPGNVNTIMRNPRVGYAVDPLCLGDAIARSRLNTDYLISLTIRPPVPVEVLRDVGLLMYKLARTILGNGIPKVDSVLGLFYSDDWEDTLNEVLKGIGTSGEPNYVYDVFSSTVYIPYRNEIREHVREWVADITHAGVLAAWGIYPLTISEEPPQVPSESLLTYYKGKKPLYDYPPSDKVIGRYTPYVAGSMASLVELYYRKYRLNENLPAVLEVLDYPPQHSPLLLQYGSPSLYSILESLRVRLGGG